MKITKAYLFAESIYDMIETVEFTYNGKITQISKEDIYFFTDTTTTIDDLMFPMSRLSALKYPINNIIKNYESRVLSLKNVGRWVSYRLIVVIVQGRNVQPRAEGRIAKDYKRYGLLKDQWQIIVSTISMKFTLCHLT